jgi:hypothetical protein
MLESGVDSLKNKVAQARMREHLLKYKYGRDSRGIKQVVKVRYTSKRDAKPEHTIQKSSAARVIYG